MRTEDDGLKPRWQRPFYAGLGVVFVGLGAAGLVIPMVPGVVFLILAAACFARSSPRLDAWLITHPRLGPPVTNWRAGGVIPRGVKWIITASIGVSFSVLLWRGVEPPMLLAVGGLMAVCLLWIWRRPERLRA